MRRGPTDALNGAPALRTVQAVTGALVLAFMAFHVLQVWAGATGPHASPRAAYASLVRTLGRPLELAIYLVGVTAVCFHLAHGLSRAVVTFGMARTPRCGAPRVGTERPRSASRCGWLLLQLLGQFALGEPLIPLDL